MSLPFGLKPDTIKPGAVRSMTSDKLATFSLGGTKKTPFQKHKEALEAKRKKEEEQTAAEYAQWVAVMLHCTLSIVVLHRSTVVMPS